MSRDVAIKFLLSDREEDRGEEKILRRLAAGPAEYLGKRHIVELLDQFELSGPNGNHRCLVTEALGRQAGRQVDRDLLSPKESWEVVRQLVEATVYIHSMNIVHGSK